MEFEKIKLIGDNDLCTYFNRRLHRYYKIDEKLVNSLENNYLWFSDPEDFNDPYDCNMHFDFQNTASEIADFARTVNEMPENYYRKMNEIQLNSRISELINNPEILYNNDVIQNKEELKKIGICCFSESDSKLLMWSHYADKHQGICLTFDVDCDKDLFLVYPFCVEYLSIFPRINWIKNRGILKLRHFAFATKSLEWSYEEEVRIVRDDRFKPFRGKINFKKDSLKEIKFGYKSSPANYQKIMGIFNSIGGYEHVRFYVAKLKKFDFGIEYEEIF